ncbi:HGL321Wp [Eremothecium sinecaudum]|uniref:HGL321Wp n=1 Tax=Eremothecium sinecaudum TaxID=45286 RepID=A0A0X8HV03_9SACH|nr:HGL321Wp [Eremothecium sinecaudum]AMD22019.1 HGL321Wp [Eremothecium sinecaudum]
MPKRVYGKFRKLSNVLNTVSDHDIKDDSWFSDDDENTDRLISDDTTKVNVTPELDLQGSEPGFSEAKSGSTKLVCDDVVWEFLEKPSPVRKRPRRIATVENDDSSDTLMNQGYKKALNTVRDILGSIKPSQGLVLDMEALRGDVDEQEEDTGCVKYGRTRTILVKKHESSDDDEEGSGNGAVDEEGDKDDPESGNMVSQHFNQLKAMGGNLKYQNDLDFILHGDASITPGKRRTEMLRLCLDITANDKLRQHIIKYYHYDVWKWCIRVLDPKDLVTSFLQCFIMDKIPLPTNDKTWSMVSISEFILQLVTDALTTPKIKGSRLVKHNYKDFLGAIECDTPSQFAIHIWDKYIPPMTDDPKVIPLLLHRLGDRDPKTISPLLSLLERHLPAIESTQDAFEGNYSKLFQLLIPLWPDWRQNEYYVKCFIKLTNSSHLLAKVENKSMLLQQSICYINERQSTLWTHTDPSCIDIVILHLGLCLNLIVEITSIITDTELQSMKSIFKEISQRIADGQMSFMANLFLLIFAYSVHKKDLELNATEHKYLISKLKAFSMDVNSYNESIFERTNYILEQLQLTETIK